MILALLALMTDRDVLATGAFPMTFRDMATCQAFIAAARAETEIHRLAAEARHGQPVRYALWCHDLGIAG